MIIQQAPAAFAGLTVAAGTAAQVLQVNAAGVLAGLASGNFYLKGPASNELNQNPFRVIVSGTILAHGATQTVAVGLQWAAISAAGVVGSLADTFTAVASGTLVAGTYYDFMIEQEFYGSALSSTLNVAGVASNTTVSVGGVPTAISTGIPASLALTNAAIASQTEPITGVNNTVNQPAFAFAVTVKNSVSDTTETVTLNQFAIVQD